MRMKTARAAITTEARERERRPLSNCQKCEYERTREKERWKSLLAVTRIEIV